MARAPWRDRASRGHRSSTLQMVGVGTQEAGPQGPNLNKLSDTDAHQCLQNGDYAKALPGADPGRIAAGEALGLRSARRGRTTMMPTIHDAQLVEQLVNSPRDGLRKGSFQRAVLRWMRLQGMNARQRQSVRQAVNVVMKEVGLVALSRLARAVAEGRLARDGHRVRVDLADEDRDRIVALLAPPATDRGTLSWQLSRGMGPLDRLLGEEQVVDLVEVRWLIAQAAQTLLALASLQVLTGHRYLRLCEAPSAKDPTKRCGRVIVDLPGRRTRRYCDAACRTRASRLRAIERAGNNRGGST